MSKSLDDMTEPELRDTMNRVAQLVARALPPGSMFLIVASGSYGPGTAQYISNCERAEMIAFMRETADRLEGREDVTR